MKSDESSDVSKAFKGPLEILQEQLKALEVNLTTGDDYSYTSAG